jgi:hypothetical protein
MTDVLDLSDLFTETPAESRREARARAGGPAAPEAVVLPGLDLSNRKLLNRAIKKRRGTPIMGYGGLNGMGKTYCMVRDSLYDLAAGRRVLSTVGLLDPHTGNPHPLYVPFRHWSQLDEWRDGPILLDEVTGVMDSRDSGMPKKVRKQIPQMRRANSPVRWTGINWDNSDRRLRQLTQAFTVARGFLPNTKLGRVDGQEEAVAMWLPNRLFMFTTYDASTLSQSDDSAQFSQDEAKKKKAKVKKRELVWGPNSLAFDCYNTLDSVDSIDNSCPICQGRVPEKTCKGHG